MTIDELRVLLRIKITQEYQLFKERLMHKTKEEIYAKSYKIDTYVTIYECLLEISQQLEEKEIRKLLISSDLLAFLYEKWLKKEDSYNVEITDHIFSEIKEQVRN